MPSFAEHAAAGRGGLSAIAVGAAVTAGRHNNAHGTMDDALGH